MNDSKKNIILGELAEIGNKKHILYLQEQQGLADHYEKKNIPYYIEGGCVIKGIKEKPPKPLNQLSLF